MCTRFKKEWLAAFVVLFLHGSPAQSAWFYVDGANGNDANSCLANEPPCKTIQAAINKAIDWDGVYVQAGTYSKATNGETFPIAIENKSLYLQAYSPETTIIDASSSNQNVIHVHGGSRYVEISNLTIKKGVIGLELLGYDRQSQPLRGLVINCNITENTAIGIFTQNLLQFEITRSFITFSGGGGLQAGISNLYSTPTITNNVIVGINGNGIYNDQATPDIVNNTIYLNYGGNGVANINNSNVQIINNLITSNGVYGIYNDGTSVSTNKYNDVWGNGGMVFGNYYNAFPGIGSISVDPWFVSPLDLHLRCSSPAINAGDNTAWSRQEDKDGNPRIVGGTVDLGAYERQLALYCNHLPLILK